MRALCPFENPNEPVSLIGWLHNQLPYSIHKPLGRSALRRGSERAGFCLYHDGDGTQHQRQVILACVPGTIVPHTSAVNLSAREASFEKAFDFILKIPCLPFTIFLVQGTVLGYKASSKPKM